MKVQGGFPVDREEYLKFKSSFRTQKVMTLGQIGS